MPIVIASPLGEKSCQILARFLERGWATRNHETVSDELKRHIPGIPSLQERNEKLLSSNLSAGALPGNQRRPRTLSDDQINMWTLIANGPEKPITYQGLLDLRVGWIAQVV